MFSNFGAVFSSSLTELSKSITNSIASHLNLPGSIKPPTIYDDESSDATLPPPFDIDVLRSYYAGIAEHRPSSRLLKERISGDGQKGPRSATLLVSGSPVFERPWRCGCVYLWPVRAD